MRIVLASFAALPKSVGGGEVHVHQLAKALNRIGHNASVLTIGEVGSEQIKIASDTFEGVVVYSLSVPKCDGIYDRDARLTAWAEQWLKEQKVDVLHLFLFNQLLGLIPAANRLGIPVCLTALEFSYFCRRYDLMYEGRRRCELDNRGVVCERCILTSYSTKQRVAASAARVMPREAESWLRSLVASRVGDRLTSLGQRKVSYQIEQQRINFKDEIAAVFTPSTIMRDFYVAQGAPTSKLYIVPYGSDLDRPPRLAHSSSDRLRLAYIGRLDPMKGVEVLCNAVRQLPSAPIELKIYGPTENGAGAYSAQILELISDDERVQLCGRLERKDLAAVYADIDALVVPSIWYENSPITISEALTMGCPVICSETQGMFDLIEHNKNGLMFPPGDSRALAQCLQRLLEQPELLSSLRAQVEPVEQADDVAARLAAVYEVSLKETLAGIPLR